MRESNLGAYLWYAAAAVLSVVALPGAFYALGIEAWNLDHWGALWRFYSMSGQVPIDLAVAGGAWLVASVVAFAAAPAIDKGGEYGSAAWATRSDLRGFKPGLTDRHGFVAGRMGGVGRFGGRLLMSASPLSMLVVAPAGTGKTAGVILPSILSCDPFSLVVNDPKGELYDLSAGHRSTLGPVFRIEWTAGAKGSVCWNPIDPVCLPAESAPRGDAVDRNTAVLVPGDEKDFWISSGRLALSALTLFQIYEGERLGFTPTYAGTLEWIAGLGQAQDPELADPTGANLDYAAGVSDIEGYPTRIAVALRQLAIMDHRTRSNVLATVIAALKIFSNENVASVTSRTDFGLADLRGNEGKPVSVYIVVPAFDQDAFGKITAMFVESATRFLTERRPNRGERPVRFILDEVGFLPPVQAISMGPAITRGYDVAFLFACQDYGQLKDRWGQGGLDNIITNTAFKVVLTQNHPETCAMLSRAIGNTTRKRKSQSRSLGVGFQAVARGSQSEQLEGAPLIRPEDIGSMKFGRHFVLAQNNMNRPVPCRSAFYLHDARLRRRAATKALEVLGSRPNHPTMRPRKHPT